jgi:RNA polymerase sigma-70 factor (ECF subfamily)
VAAVRSDLSPAYAFRVGETETIERLHARYSDQLLRFCRSRLSSREEAEDAVQMTYLYALLALRRGVEPTFESAWLYKIAANVCLSRGRTTGRRRRVELPTDTDRLEVAGPESDGGDLIGLDEALAAMPERQRRAILLREWQGLSYREIAAELGLTQSATETLIFRARRSLAGALSGAKELPRASALVLLSPGALVKGAKSFLGLQTVKAAAVVAVSASVVTALAGDRPEGALVAGADRPSPVPVVATAPAGAAPVLPEPSTRATPTPAPPRDRGARPPKPVRHGPRGAGPSAPAGDVVPGGPDAPAVPDVPGVPAPPSVTLPQLPLPPELDPGTIIPEVTDRLPDLPPVELPEVLPPDVAETVDSLLG